MVVGELLAIVTIGTLLNAVLVASGISAFVAASLSVGLAVVATNQTRLADWLFPNEGKTPEALK